MHYEGTVIRPPSEADSIILQVTVGCSHNHCTFCGAYKDVRFRLKEEEIVDQDISFASKFCLRQKRVFLADGDALIIPQPQLEQLFRKIRHKLPDVSRISLYANARSIRKKSIKELCRLKDMGLDRVYLGIESGDNQVLEDIVKSETAHSLSVAGKKIIDAGLFLSTSVILGLAGKSGSMNHARLTADLLNKICPNQIAALTLIPLANTELGKRVSNNKFTLLTPVEILQELRVLVDNISIDRTQFMANHASNYLPLTGRLKKDKNKILTLIDKAIDGVHPLVDEKYRAL